MAASFDVWATYQALLANEQVRRSLSLPPINSPIQLSTPLAAILALTALVERSDGTLSLGCPPAPQ